MFFAQIDSGPTYGELIDLLLEVEGQADATDSLCKEMERRYPDIPIDRPSRLHDTIQRIAAPTRPSIRGGSAKLSGSPLKTYRTRKWKPCIRNAGMV